MNLEPLELCRQIVEENENKFIRILKIEIGQQKL